MADFLKNLPTHNADNFTKINPDTCHRSSTGKKTAYVPVKDIPADQVIVTEKTNILLRFLHQQWDKKATTKKRSGEAGAGSEEAAKKPRLDPVRDQSNTSPGHGQYLLASGSSQPVNRFANQQ
eukprot:TRINITY_DN3694_c0_g1_i2.p2 TRINITY_DN3694_c0_g1~~TRINITY_DN3694_c0_g1_i2.p2  ORF type:complete len:141 (-),score=47.92 TRINITY_DN3694_c0_g1_i2:110-478(-)